MLTIPQSLQTKLRDVQRAQLSREFPDENLTIYDAVALSYGLGPAVYLTFQGEMIVWDYSTNALPYKTNRLSDIGSYLTIGSRELKLPALLTLLPLATSTSTECQTCNGYRWKQLPNSSHDVVCWTCHGLGWIVSPVAEAWTNNPMDRSGGSTAS